MQASSLIFLAIVAIWAAYFLQYWVRRREHLATARSVDRFSESMRLLELRSPVAEGVPTSFASRQEPRSYAVSPARSVGSASRDGSVGEPSPSAHGRERSRPGALRRSAGAGSRVRGLVFLATLVALTAVSVLAARAFVPLWAVGIPGGLVLFAFVWMRLGVRASTGAARRERASTARERRSERDRQSARDRQSDGDHRVARSGRPQGRAARAGDRGGGQALVARHQGSVELEAVEVGPVDDEVESAPVPAQGVGAREVPFDIEATSEPLGPPPPPPRPPAPVRYALVDEDDIPLTWDPVPVPRPTYTMKSRALRPDPEPAPVAPQATFAPEAGAPAYRLEPERRVAGI